MAKLPHNKAFMSVLLNFAWFLIIFWISVVGLFSVLENFIFKSHNHMQYLIFSSLFYLRGDAHLTPPCLI